MREDTLLAFDNKSRRSVQPFNPVQKQFRNGYHFEAVSCHNCFSRCCYCCFMGFAITFAQFCHSNRTEWITIFALLIFLFCFFCLLLSRVVVHDGAERETLDSLPAEWFNWAIKHLKNVQEVLFAPISERKWLDWIVWWKPLPCAYQALFVLGLWSRWNGNISCSVSVCVCALSRASRVKCWMCVNDDANAVYTYRIYKGKVSCDNGRSLIFIAFIMRNWK